MLMKRSAILLFIAVLAATACTERTATPPVEFIEVPADTATPKANESIVGDGPIIVIPEERNPEDATPISEDDELIYEELIGQGKE